MTVTFGGMFYNYKLYHLFVRFQMILRWDFVTSSFLTILWILCTVWWMQLTCTGPGEGKFMGSTGSVKYLWQPIFTYLTQNKLKILFRVFFSYICYVEVFWLQLSFLKWSCYFKQFFISSIHYDLVHGSDVIRPSLNSGNYCLLSCCSFILTLFNTALLFPVSGVSLEKEAAFW